MSATAPAGNPKGIFDRSSKGKILEPVKVIVERGKIRFFTKVLGETNPIHFDVTAARSKGYPDLVAPPSFFTAIDASANEERARQGQTSIAAIVNCDFRYLLHGAETYEYLGLIFAADELTMTTLITDFYDKKGGDLEFVTFVSVLEHAERGVLVRATRNLLHRLA